MSHHGCCSQRCLPVSSLAGPGCPSDASVVLHATNGGIKKLSDGRETARITCVGQASFGIRQSSFLESNVITSRIKTHLKRNIGCQPAEIPI